MLFNQPRKKKIDCKGESMIYISKMTFFDMFKGNEEAEAGNTNRQVVVLSRKTFLLVNAITSDLSTTLVYKARTCS